MVTPTYDLYIIYNVWRCLDKVTGYLRGWKDFLSSKHVVFLASQKEMRHLALQDMSLPYLSEERFKNRSVDEGNVRY